MAKLLSGTRVYGNLTVDTFITATGNITGGNVTGTTGAFTTVTGNANATSLTSGTVPSARLSGSYTINISGAATTAGTVTTAAQPNITSVGTLSALSVTGNVTAGNLLGTIRTAAQTSITSVGTLTALSVTGNITGANLRATSNVEIQNRGILFLNDSDNSNYIGLRSPAALAGNFLYTFPDDYGSLGQVLSTNGAGTLTWEDAGGGSSATQFPNSTVQPVPGSTGNFDLSFNFVQTVQETPFEVGGQDPFGVNLGEVYSMMDPVGEILTPVDLGALT